MTFSSLLIPSLLISFSGCFAQSFIVLLYVDFLGVERALNTIVQVDASTELNRACCYDGLKFTCFPVPLDYSNEDGAKVGIAVTKYPSTATVAEDNYRGPVIFNPGVLAKAEAFFSADTERQVLRVVNATHDPTLIPKKWANAQLLGQMAKEYDTKGMQHDRVQRLIIDGLLDSEASYSGHGDWRTHIVAADAALQTFFDGFPAAGLAHWAFYAESASQIQAKFESLYPSVLASPFITRIQCSRSLRKPWASFKRAMERRSTPCNCEGSAEPYANAWENVYAVAYGDAVENTESATGVTAYWDEIH
ncbi:hypothetical protein BDZ89DRAFT_1204336 [Hymenopellis radicata]|nr:hypothetical protein BDZ89DRAFT_1204336 [Hymenopellis radicata]